MSTTLEQLGLLLSEAAPPQASAQLASLRGCPRVDVDDYGEIVPPLTPAALRSLLRLAVPAPYGKGEDTLLDPAVRDTWQIPSSMVTIDWNGRLGEVLDEAREALGLPPTCQLRAEFQSLLVYERGQFFLAHQDSQRCDDMVASLVVLLPSPGSGGELVVADGEQATTYGASRSSTTLVTFYADRLHEVRPVRSGHRIALTYNLTVTGDTQPHIQPRSADGDPVARAADLLQEYFATPQRSWGAPPELPTRVAYLLDHEYAERGLDRTRLKGADSRVAAILTAAAGRLGYEVVLALTDVHEIHEEFDLDGEPLDADITVTHWVRPDGLVVPTQLQVGRDETVGTPSRRLRPYASEHEGYMGNYGNTMDRWYRRAALLLWPRHLAFAQRCEAAPATALEELLARLGEGDHEGARRDLGGVAPAWPSIVRSCGRAVGPGPSGTASPAPVAELLGLAMSVADQVCDPDLARTLLEPFRIEGLRAETMDALSEITERYGEAWVTELLRGWSADARGFHPFGGEQSWLLEVPGLVRAAPDRPALVAQIVALAWARLRHRIEHDAKTAVTSRAQQELADLGEPVAALLEAATLGVCAATRDEILATCRRDDLVDLIIVVLDRARGWPEPLRAGSGVGALAEYAVARLRARVEAPRRAADDWSILAATSCDCRDCATLEPFLADPARTKLEWKLAKAGRQHVHGRLDGAELPVRHVTRRTGSPFTLVLTKTRELFDREDRDRERARVDLARLRAD